MKKWLSSFLYSIRIHWLVRIRALTWTRHHRDISHPWPNTVRAGHVTLLSWREWWENITNLGWLTLCSPPQVENDCMLQDCPYWGSRCELFKDINNFAILASCWWYFYASLTRNSSNLRSFSAFSFNWRSNLLSCTAIEALFHVLSLTNHAWWTWFFLNSCVEA